MLTAGVEGAVGGDLPRPATGRCPQSIGSKVPSRITNALVEAVFTASARVTARAARRPTASVMYRYAVVVPTPNPTAIRALGAPPAGGRGSVTAPQMRQHQESLPSRGQPAPARALFEPMCSQFTGEEAQGRGGQINAGWVDKDAEAPGRTAWIRHPPVYQELLYVRTPSVPHGKQVGKRSVT